MSCCLQVEARSLVTWPSRPPLVPVPLARTTSRRFVLGVVALVVVLRLGYLVGPLFSDEAGYLLVAQDWHAGGPNLYGHYFVDRPPLLMALYRVAVLTGWPPTVRLLATLFAVVLRRVGRLGGPPGRGGARRALGRPRGGRLRRDAGW